jgi:hypothetical protein
VRVGLIGCSRKGVECAAATPRRGPTSMSARRDKCGGGSKDTRAVCPYRRCVRSRFALVREMALSAWSPMSGRGGGYKF